MTRHPFLSLISYGLLCGFAVGQMSTLPAAQAIADLPGPAKNPPIFSEMTVIMQGGLQYQNTIDLKGPVASMEREETQSTSDNPNPFHVTTRLKFDADGHLTQAIHEDLLGASTTSNVWANGRLQSQIVHHHRGDGKSSDWDEWQRWSYDKDGRLSEFHAGRDKVEWNYYSNFKYDTQARPLGYEYRDSKIAGPPAFTEISYDGKTVALSRFDGSHRKFYQQVQVVDDRNRVVDLKVSDLSGGQLKQWYHVKFKYDEKGRVIEQDTDPFKLGEGDDYSPIPGKLLVEYNDEKQAGEQKLFDIGGKLILHTTFAFDRDGIPTELQVLDASGKERTGGELFVDADHKGTTRPGSVKWEVTYDDHGNWIERRRWFTPADGSPRIMTRLIRQQITYR